MAGRDVEEPYQAISTHIKPFCLREATYRSSRGRISFPAEDGADVRFSGQAGGIRGLLPAISNLTEGRVTAGLIHFAINRVPFNWRRYLLTRTNSQIFSQQTPNFGRQLTRGGRKTPEGRPTGENCRFVTVFSGGQFN